MFLAGLEPRGTVLECRLVTGNGFDGHTRGLEPRRFATGVQFHVHPRSKYIPSAIRVSKLHMIPRHLDQIPFTFHQEPSFRVAVG